MKRKKRVTKIKKQNRTLFLNEEIINLVLEVIGLILIIYGAWFHNILWLLLGFVPFLVGSWWNKVHKNGKK